MCKCASIVTIVKITIRVIFSYWRKILNNIQWGKQGADGILKTKNRTNANVSTVPHHGRATATDTPAEKY